MKRLFLNLRILVNDLGDIRSGEKSLRKEIFMDISHYEKVNMNEKIQCSLEFKNLKKAGN